MMDDTEMEASVTLLSSSSIGAEALERGQRLPDDDDSLYYIPERRPSLDLGQMDTSQWYFMEKASSPALSYWSMTSEENSNSMDEEDRSPTRVQLEREDSFSSSYSFNSDDSENQTSKVKIKDSNVSKFSDTPDQSEISHPSLTVAFTFKAICKTLDKLPEDDMKTFKMMLLHHHQQSFNILPQSMDVVDIVDQLLESYSLGESLQITKTLLEEIGQKRLFNYLQTLCVRNEVLHDLRETLKKTYSDVCEDSAMQGEKRPLHDVFINPCITSTCDNGPNIDHEVMTIGKLDSNQIASKLLSTRDILSAEMLKQSNLNFLLITGIAGTGKSMAFRKLVLDWTEERSHQHVSFLFPMPFRELRQFESSEISLLEIIHTLYPVTKKLRDEDYRSEDCKLMFVFDGLDEYNGELDFQETDFLSDYTKPSNLDAIMVNLLRGKLLYHSLFVVFSRPQVKHCIPWDVHYNMVDICGFCDPEKDEYFKKRFQDQDQAARAIAFVNSSKTLRIMCHLPLFCSLVAKEYQCLFREQGLWAELPRGITYMYTKLLLALTRELRRFRAPDHSPYNERDFLMKLGKLAFEMLEQNRFKITKEDWNQAGICDVEAVSNSGLCTQYLTKTFVLYQEKVLSFIHPTMQEYLAALYAFLSFRNLGKNVFDKKITHKLMGYKAIGLYMSAVDRSLLCDNGKLDILLRFLFGMAVDSNLELLTPFCTSSGKWPTFIEDANKFIRKRIRENRYPNRTRNLYHCLEEMGV
ncbi:protein NLRC3 [Antennarius striatus]|uniref:protein NLRC3 n=1 Tax=Antennarius striatus TaxID=241820 RepID=UPI0035AE983F